MVVQVAFSWYLWRRERLPTPVFWPGEFRGLYSPWGPKESDTTEWLSLFLTDYALQWGERWPVCGSKIRITGHDINCWRRQTGKCVRKYLIGKGPWIGGSQSGFIPGPWHLCLFKIFFFFMWATFKVFTEFVTILTVLCFGFGAWGMWDLSSPTRDRTCTPALGGKVLSTGPPGKSLEPWHLCWNLKERTGQGLECAEGSMF